MALSEQQALEPDRTKLVAKKQAHTTMKASYFAAGDSQSHPPQPQQ